MSDFETIQASNAASTAPQAKTKPIKYKSGEEFFAQLEAELGYSKPQAGNAVSTAPQTETKPIKYKSDEEFFAQLEAELGYSKPQASNAVSVAPQAKTKPIKYKSGEEFFAQLEAELGYSKPQASGGIWETVKAFGRDLTHVPAEFVEGGQNTVDSLRLLMKYSDEFKTAVREDILNRIENENGFAEKFNSLRKKLDDDNLFRQAAYEAYA